MNYNTLFAQILSYSNRTDQAFRASIPYFIEMGQQRIWRELTATEFEKIRARVESRMTAGNAFVEKPADWNKTVSFIYGLPANAFVATNVLRLRTYEFCRAYWPDSTLTDPNNPPLFYSEHLDPNIGTKDFFISPTPDQNYRYELTYLKRVDLITDENTNNLLTDDYPDLLFYACFLEALTYLRDDERVQVFEQNYARALASAQQKTTDRHMDRVTDREVD